MKQILPKSAGAGIRLQVAVGGSDDAYGDFALPGVTQADDHAILQHTQQVGLHVERHFTDFVEKQGAAVGLLELSGQATAAGPRKGALTVAKQFAGQQFAGQCAAIDGDEGAFRLAARLVDGPREDFLAGTGFPEQQDRQVERCNAPRPGLCGGDGGAGADDLGEDIRYRAVRAVQGWQIDGLPRWLADGDGKESTEFALAGADRMQPFRA